MRVEPSMTVGVPASTVLPGASALEPHASPVAETKLQLYAISIRK